MVPLPIDRSLPEIVDALRRSRSLVIVAPPGAGKTTRVPMAMLRSGVVAGEHRNIVMLQPRRVAARAAAARIAQENGWDLGREVGYHVRFDRKIGRDTRLRVLTEGILNRQLLDDPFLDGIGAVVLDEFHERSLHTDVAIALLREVQETVRPDLKIIVMSATLEAGPVAKFLGECPIVRTEGRAYPIEIRYAPAIRGEEEAAVVRAVTEIIDGGMGRWSGGEITPHAPPPHRPIPPSPSQRDILIFLPGAEEIRRVMRGLEGLAERENLSMAPLHGSLTGDEQDRAIRPDPTGRRKIICATNIAETSLTIDGVGVVIDTGLARVAGYDVERGLDKLEVMRISKASATQRAGRAGRTGPGVAIRLWSEKEWDRMEAFETPEIRRVDLCATVLELHAWGKSDPRSFGWFERPDEEILSAAEGLLSMLGAVDERGRITEVGRRLAGLPVHPRLGRLLVAAADRGLTREGATLAALMSERDILRWERNESRDSLAAGAGRVMGTSDLLVRMELIESRSHDPRIDSAALRQVLRVRDELERVASKDERQRQTRMSAPPKLGEAPPEDELLKLVLWAYPDRVCRRRGGQDRGVMVGGGGVRLSPESVVRQGDFFVAVDARRDERSVAREAFVRIASAIDVAWLEEMFSAQIRREREVIYDEQRERVSGVARVWYRDLLLREDKDLPVDASQADEALRDVLRRRAAEIFRADEEAHLVLMRVALLRDKMPEKPWPAWDDAELGEILADASAGRRSLADVKGLPLGSILKSALSYPLDRLLEQEAPDALEVPSGSVIRLRYAPGEVTLAARLQELFGWLETPRIAAGRVAVKVELLGPNYRPVQVTSDLRSFWASAYFQVRKDLKARYPKHAWPEDPLTARAEARGGRKRSS
ncbi:MAG: ATP-dependent helicase HrpB [Phycisphaerales bacterium]|nr:ATP-dependent helicase HrpB [Phycisphaerales bacterium]